MSRLEQLKKLVMLEPNDPMSHYGLGLEYINLEQWEEAAAAFAQAIAVNEQYSAAYYHKARAELAAGRNADAVATLDHGMEVARTAGDWKTENEMRELREQAT